MKLNDRLFLKLFTILSLALAVGCAASAVNKTASGRGEPEKSMTAKAEDFGSLGNVFLAWSRDRGKEAERYAAALKSGRTTGMSTAERLAGYNNMEMNLSDGLNQSGLNQYVHPDEGMRKAAVQAERELTDLSVKLGLDRELYEAMAAVDSSGLDPVSKRFVEKVIKDFKRNGVDRDEATRAKVRELSRRITELAQGFDKNLADDTRSVSISDAARLKGLPEDYLKSHPPGPDGLIKITTDWPDYYPVMLYADDGELRRDLMFKAYNLGYPQNVEVFKQLLQARRELSATLGYPNWAAYATEEAMIQDPGKATAFIERIAGLARGSSERDKGELLRQKMQIDPKATEVFQWEKEYLSRLCVKRKYDFDPETARSYFELPKVRQGILDLSSRLYGISFKPDPTAVRWHENVDVYDVIENGNRIGRIYLDLYPRENKYKSFAMFPIIQGVKGERIPEGAIVGNFPDPTKSKEPVLIDHLDVTTFFHEFGHLLHHILAGNVEYARFSGTNVQFDFVEAPSQLYEEWAWDPGILRAFAVNSRGEPIPVDLVKRMKDADEFGKGLMAMRQMYYAAISLGLYVNDPAGAFDPEKFSRETEAKYSPWAPFADTHFIYGFGHLTGYSSNYYTYMWSLVIAKDLAATFKERGIGESSVAMSYRRSVLDMGGTRDGGEMVRGFLGRDFDFKAFEAWLQK